MKNHVILYINCCSMNGKREVSFYHGISKVQVLTPPLPSFYPQDQHQLFNHSILKQEQQLVCLSLQLSAGDSSRVFISLSAGNLCCHHHAQGMQNKRYVEQEQGGFSHQQFGCILVVQNFSYFSNSLQIDSMQSRPYCLSSLAKSVPFQANIQAFCSIYIRLERWNSNRLIEKVRGRLGGRKESFLTRLEQKLQLNVLSSQPIYQLIHSAKVVNS